MKYKYTQSFESDNPLKLDFSLPPEVILKLARECQGFKEGFKSFEELPESQEEKDHSKCSASFCNAGGRYENCTHPDNDFEKARRNKPQKEECKHEHKTYYRCLNCGSEAETQPRQLPSQWINEKLQERAILHGSAGADDYLRVLCDFLDSHADLFNK